MVIMSNKPNLLNPSAVVVGNPDNNVAICTLWSQRDVIASRLERGSFFICGNLYSLEGVNQLIRTIYMNPWIRFIVICGEDLSRSGETLLRLFNDGVDDDNGIIGTNFKSDKNIPKEKIDLLRQNVKAVDMRRRSSEELRQAVNELPKGLGPFTEAQEFPSASYGVDYIPSELIGYNIHTKTVGEAWLSLLDMIMKLGVEKNSEYGIKQKELLDVLVTVDESGGIPEYFSFTEDYLKNYEKQIVTAEKPDGVSYTYGERLFGSNQVDAAVERLKKSAYTRRAVATAWRLDDATGASPPCLMQVVWNIQFNKLYQTAVIRSQDTFSAFPLNALALMKLQKQVAEKLGISAGTSAFFCISQHLYETNWRQSSEIVARYRKPDYRFQQDTRGSFVIRTEGSDIVVDFYTVDGSKTQHSFRGTDVIRLYKEISQSNFISRLDHAANLGMELYKAGLAIKERKNYVQDEELK